MQRVETDRASLSARCDGHGKELTDLNLTIGCAATAKRLVHAVPAAAAHGRRPRRVDGRNRDGQILKLERERPAQCDKEKNLHSQVGGCTLAVGVVHISLVLVRGHCGATVSGAPKDAHRWSAGCVVSPRRPNDVISSAEKRPAIPLAEQTDRAAVERGGNAGKIRVHASLATSPVFSPTCINPAALASGMLMPAYARLWQAAEQRRRLKAKVAELELSENEVGVRSVDLRREH